MTGKPFLKSLTPRAVTLGFLRNKDGLRLDEVWFTFQRVRKGTDIYVSMCCFRKVRQLRH